MASRYECIPLSPASIENLSMIDDRLWAFEQRPRKIYVGASLHNAGKASRIALQLIDAGFEVTSQWLRRDFSGAPGENPHDWSRYKDLQVEMGEVDLKDLENADTLVLLTDVPSSGGGLHVELGYFLAKKWDNNILVVGPRRNVFFWTERVRHTHGCENLVEFLQSPEHGKPPGAPLSIDSFINNYMEPAIREHLKIMDKNDLARAESAGLPTEDEIQF